MAAVPSDRPSFYSPSQFRVFYLSFFFACRCATAPWPKDMSARVLLFPSTSERPTKRAPGSKRARPMFSTWPVCRSPASREKASVPALRPAGVNEDIENQEDVRQKSPDESRLRRILSSDLPPNDHGDPATGLTL